MHEANEAKAIACKADASLARMTLKVAQLELDIATSRTTREADHAKACRELEEWLCKICEQRVISFIFQCGHTVCSDCADKLVCCHLCRGSVSKAIKVYV